MVPSEWKYSVIVSRSVVYTYVVLSCRDVNRCLICNIHFVTYITVCVECVACVYLAGFLYFICETWLLVLLKNRLAGSIFWVLIVAHQILWTSLVHRI